MTRVQKPYHSWGGILMVCLMLLSGVAMAAERGTGQVVDDALVTTKIKASFAADAQVSALAIDVDTVNGVRHPHWGGGERVSAAAGHSTGAGDRRGAACRRRQPSREALTSGQGVGQQEVAQIRVCGHDRPAIPSSRSGHACTPVTQINKFAISCMLYAV